VIGGLLRQDLRFRDAFHLVPHSPPDGEPDGPLNRAPRLAKQMEAADTVSAGYEQQTNGRKERG
jgi:hypothetical protein